MISQKPKVGLPPTYYFLTSKSFQFDFLFLTKLLFLSQSKRALRLLYIFIEAGDYDLTSLIKKIARGL